METNTPNRAAEYLPEATANRDAARAKFDAAKRGTKAWCTAAEDLNFWQGKVAMLEVLATR